MLIKYKPLSNKKHLSLALEAVQIASKLAVNFYDDAGIVSLLNKDIKTNADSKLNDIIINVLRKSGLPILSEENETNNFYDKDLYWVIDPLDGTYNFSRRFPVANISIALVYSGIPILGVIKDVYSKNMWYAIEGGGCFYNKQLVKVSNISNISEAVLSTGFPSGSSFNELELNKLLNNIKRFKKIRMLGAASSMLGYVAKGSFDVYYENDIYIWDVAAGLCLIREAGGEIFMRKNFDDHKYEILASNKGIFSKAKELLLI
jgi:myo-inositol-1(or 4)-monophosphatase